MGAVLIALFGVWLLLQTLVGDLPGVILRIPERLGAAAGGIFAGPTGSGLSNLYTGPLSDLELDPRAGVPGVTGPTGAMQQIQAAIDQRGFNVRGSGAVQVCRFTNLGDGRTSSSWSQHAYRNADDYYGSPAELQRLYDYLKANPDNLPVGTVCYNRQGPCSHPHTDHLHVDGLPRQYGRPRGC